MNDVSEAGDKHTYQAVTIRGQMAGYWTHLQGTARQYLVCNPVTQQIKPMTFNPIMGCIYFIHWQGQATSKTSNKATEAAKNKPLLVFIMHVWRWAGYNELSPANTWNPLLRCPNDKQGENSGEQELIGESRVETQLTSDTGGQGRSTWCDCVCQILLYQAIYWSALRLCHLHCALYWTRVGSSGDH